MLLTGINGIPIHESSFARAFLDAGFVAAPLGFNVRRLLPPPPALAESGSARA